MLSKGSKRKRFKRHGFFKRMSTRAGQKVLSRRRAKGRWRIVPVKRFCDSW